MDLYTLEEKGGVSTYSLTITHYSWLFSRALYFTTLLSLAMSRKGYLIPDLSSLPLFFKVKSGTNRHFVAQLVSAPSANFPIYPQSWDSTCSIACALNCDVVHKKDNGMIFLELPYFHKYSLLFYFWIT